jgi:hypothetical protein
MELKMKAELLGVGVLCAALVACSEKAPAATTPAPPSVVVTRAVQQDVPIHNEWIGTTEGDVNAEIRPKVEGYLLERVYTEGALVHKGIHFSKSTPGSSGRKSSRQTPVWRRHRPPSARRSETSSDSSRLWRIER